MTDNRYTYQQAVDLCEQLNVGGAVGVGGAGDWRLPSVKELLTIIDPTRIGAPMIDVNTFPNTPTAYFWTSTTSAANVLRVWSVSMTTGENETSDTNAALRVRCVR